MLHPMAIAAREQQVGEGRPAWLVVRREGRDMVIVEPATLLQALTLRLNEMRGG